MIAPLTKTSETFDVALEDGCMYPIEIEIDKEGCVFIYQYNDESTDTDLNEVDTICIPTDMVHIIVKSMTRAK